MKDTLTRQPSASISVAFALLKDEIWIGSLGDPQRARQQHIFGTDPHNSAF